MPGRVGVAPGTTAFVVSSPDFRCLNCAPGGFAGAVDRRGPLVNGRLDLAALGIPCPPDPVVQFLTNPFIPDSTTPSQYRHPATGIPVGPGPIMHPTNPYGTESTLMGSPLGVSWKVAAGILGAALLGGGAVGWFTRKRRRR